MRRLLIAGNWKMHMPNPEAVGLARQIKVKAMAKSRVDVLVCPPSTALTAVSEILRDSEVRLGAQNLHHARGGAFTGEITGEMIRSTGATQVIVGHSERRQFFADTNEWVNKKLFAAIEAGLHPIFCLGETLDERESGDFRAVVSKQFEEGLMGFTPELMKQITIAYEPVWAIGTGVVASPAQAQEVHALLRELSIERFGETLAQSLRILYGGSVKPDNAHELLGQKDIDGALVGGASLKAADFGQIIEAAESVVK
jgi:triosephosphate isomerase (TIM)